MKKTEIKSISEKQNHIEEAKWILLKHYWFPQNRAQQINPKKKKNKNMSNIF